MPEGKSKNDYERLSGASEACHRLLGWRPDTIEFPGGKSRKSVRARGPDGSVIITRRRAGGRGELEANVLRNLSERTAAVPKVLEFDGTWLIQEDIGERRLSQALATASEAEGERWLTAALDSLLEIQDTAHTNAIGVRAPRIGTRADWIAKLLSMPQQIGEHLGVAAPELPTRELTNMLNVGEPVFIKWDARPGNAIVRKDESVAWIDWEHCGRRHPLDDLAWLFGDEYTPYWPDVENELIGPFLKKFAPTDTEDTAGAYLATFGTFHMCVRLGLILEHKGEGTWWDEDYCLIRDKIGVTAPAAKRLCTRGARWAARGSLIEAFVPWWEAVADCIDEDDRPVNSRRP